MSNLNLTLIDVIIRYRPFTTLRRRAMSGEFLSGTTVLDILVDPLRTAYRLRMETGIGLKSQSEIIAAVHDALESEFGDDWFAVRDGTHPDAAQVEPVLDARLRAFLFHWPRPDTGEAIGDTVSDRKKGSHS